VTCDIFLSRRSGSITVENISVVERVEKTAAVVSNCEGGMENPTRRLDLTGFVTEVVQSRKFGLITAVDENGYKTGEHVFFHFREVDSGHDEARDGISQPPGRKKPAKVDIIIDKGEEVKFDVGPGGKNGKLNATNIHVLPRGTLKFQSKADTPSSCTGYILIEPSYTSLLHASSNVVMQSNGPAAGAGRWANVRDDKSSTKPGSSMKEGVILLLL
jgi:cold shock CspA family protein